MSLREMEKVLTWEQVARATAARTGQTFTGEEEEALCGEGGAERGMRSAGTSGTSGRRDARENNAGGVRSAIACNTAGRAGAGQTSSKFRNVRVKEDGHTFDSEKERDRYMVLKAMEQKGEIRNLEHHRRFRLEFGDSDFPTDLGQSYEPDFVYEEKCFNTIPRYDADAIVLEVWRSVAEDVKPTFRDETAEKRYKRLPHYRLSALKQAILRAMGYEVREV